jgi:hypothetical protein
VVFQEQLLREGMWEQVYGRTSPFRPHPYFLRWVKHYHPTHLYCSGEISFHDYTEEVKLLERGYNRDWSLDQSAQKGVSIEEPKLVQHQLVHAHGQFFDLECPLPPQHPQCKFIVTVRDPLLSICSGLRRVGNPENPRMIIREFQKLVDFPGYKFCIDQYRTRIEKDNAVRMLFKHLGLSPNASCRKWAKLWSGINETSAEIENFDLYWSPDQVEELREARRMLSANKIHPILQPWVDELRASGLQRKLQALNYRNLPWFL